MAGITAYTVAVVTKEQPASQTTVQFFFLMPVSAYSFFPP